MSLIRSVCVYAGSRNAIPEIFHQSARDLGEQLGKNSFNLIYGGAGDGLMGSISQSVQRSGGKVIEVLNNMVIHTHQAPEGTTVYKTNSIAEQQQKMFELSDAFIAIPGGIGTLDEWIGLLALRDLNVHQKPVFVLNTERIWEPLKQWLHNIMLHGFSHGDISKYVTFCDTPEEVLKELFQYYLNKSLLS